jgi:hypothetical protein
MYPNPNPGSEPPQMMILRAGKGSVVWWCTMEVHGLIPSLKSFILT